MNEMTIFNFNGKEVRMIDIDTEPWWVAKDVAEILEYSETAMMTRRLDEDEKTTLPLRQDGSNYQTNITLINESGLYNAILGSKKPEAKIFTKWVTSVVLPSIRKTGAYGTSDKMTQKFFDMAYTHIEIINKQMDVIQKFMNEEPVHEQKAETKNTSDEDSVWITTIELAELLGCTRATAISRGLRAGWEKRTSSLRGYLTYEYRLSGLHRDVQEKYNLKHA